MPTHRYPSGCPFQSFKKTCEGQFPAEAFPQAPDTSAHLQEHTVCGTTSRQEPLDDREAAITLTNFSSG